VPNVAWSCLTAFSSDLCELPIHAFRCCVLPDHVVVKRHKNGAASSTRWSITAALLATIGMR
jgi:hypothetical protein